MIESSSRGRMRAIAAVSLFTLAASTATAARAESCRSAIGPERAARLVERCIEVSPATRPPCNADNACALIESEIARGCRMIDDGSAPVYCRRY